MVPPTAARREPGDAPQKQPGSLNQLVASAYRAKYEHALSDAKDHNKKTQGHSAGVMSSSV